MNIQEKLASIIQKNNSLVCVGLDSKVDRLPETVSGDQFEFNSSIIDATHDLVIAYKPNTAFYESRGSAGIAQLKKTCDYIRQHYPDVLIILDAKRADIGSTNQGYVQFAFDYLDADAVTLHPYLGREAVEPFLSRDDKACIILCRTSNSGAGEFQDLISDDDPVYMHVARHVSGQWNTNDNCMLVVGATYPEELKRVREIVGDMTLLVPGVGAQGGDLESVMKAGLNSQSAGMIINSSRSIIFASDGDDFADQARAKTEKLRNDINTYRT